MNARIALLIVLLSSSAACSKRPVQVRTAPTPTTATQAPAPQVQVNSTLAQAVNVYVTVNGADTFLRQVGANSSVTVPVQGVAPGSTVTLKAVTIDGSRTYTRGNVVLNGTVVFPLP
ncbi:MAG TPA: hypothetical protein VHV78_05760 [Gemmatimonadaceae bacterium]|jgi:hypothetical protein|nr:hypothetical protein [Gemmatimonadaceae bacterium]